MPKLKVRGLKKVDRNGFAQPKPNLYTAKVHGIEQKDSSAGNPMLVVQLKVTNRRGPQKEFKGAILWHRVMLPKSDNEEPNYFLAEFLDAVGLTNGGKKDSVNADYDDIIGTDVQVLVKAGSYNDEYKAEVKKLMASEDSEATEEEDAEPAEEEETEEEEEEEEEEAEPDDEEEGDGGGDDDEEEEESYDDWPLGDLKEEAEARGLKKTGPKSALVKRLIEDDEEADDPFND